MNIVITGASKGIGKAIADSIEVDIKGAINAGIDQVYVNHLGEICNIEPTYIVGSLKELQDIF